MADCSKTAEFLREWNRMCSAFFTCAGCQANSNSNGHDCSCGDLKNEHPDDAISIVQKWSDEHPAMTWEGKLRELLPGAKEEALETIKHSFCPSDIFGFGGDGDCATVEQCKAYWNGEYKEELERRIQGGKEVMPYMQNCGNCKFSERDECFEQLECKCPASDLCGDLVNEGFACHQWEMRAQAMD